jgi:hypothetical protein
MLTYCSYGGEAAGGLRKTTVEKPDCSISQQVGQLYTFLLTSLFFMDVTGSHMNSNCSEYLFTGTGSVGQQPFLGCHTVVSIGRVAKAVGIKK